MIVITFPITVVWKITWPTVYSKTHFFKQYTEFLNVSVMENNTTNQRTQDYAECINILVVRWISWSVYHSDIQLVEQCLLGWGQRVITNINIGFYTRG